VGIGTFHLTCSAIVDPENQASVEAVAAGLLARAKEKLKEEGITLVPASNEPYLFYQGLKEE
jgi:hypothetical protein